MLRQRLHASSSSPLLFSLVIVACTLAALIVLSQADPLTTTLGSDAGIFAYGGQTILEGKTLYVNFWDNKPPGIFFINAAALGAAHGSRWGIWFAEFVSLLVATVIGFYVLRKQFGPGPALVASLLWMAGLNLVLEGGNFTEEYTLPLSFLCLLIFVIGTESPLPWWSDLAFGLLTGAALLLRPNNAGVPFSIVCTWILMSWIQHRSRQILVRLPVIAAGVLLVWLTAAAYFASRNAFQPFLEASFLYNLYYSGGHTSLWKALSSGVLNLGFPVGVASIGVVLAVERLVAQLRGGRADPLYAWICIDFVVEVALSALSGRNYPHYFILWLPWMAVAACLMLFQVFPAFRVWPLQWISAVLVLGIGLGFVGFSDRLAGYGSALGRFATEGTLPEYEEPVPLYVNEHTQPGDTVLVWGQQTGINFLSKRDAASAYLFPVLIESPFTQGMSQQFYDQVRGNPPALIVDPPSDGTLVPLSVGDPVKWSGEHDVYAPPYLAEFFAFVKENYSYKTTVAGADIYRRHQNGSSP